MDLSDNVITRVAEGTFSQLSNLKTLDLSRNSLTILEEGAFKGLWSLDSLSMSEYGYEVYPRPSRHYSLPILEYLLLP